MNTVIVIGPAGCGKTRNGKALAQFFGCDGVNDEIGALNPVKVGMLNLGEGQLHMHISDVCWQPVTVMSFELAMSKMRNAESDK